MILMKCETQLLSSPDESLQIWTLMFSFTYSSKLVPVCFGLFVCFKTPIFFSILWPHMRVFSPSRDFEYAQILIVNKFTFILTGLYKIPSWGFHFYVLGLWPTFHNKYKILPIFIKNTKSDVPGEKRLQRVMVSKTQETKCHLQLSQITVTHKISVGKNISRDKDAY